MAVKKCPLCKKQYDNIDSLSNHIESEHGSEIPDGWSGGKYYFYKRNGRHTGKCRICGKDTTFNENTYRPNVFCGNPKCEKAFRDTFVQRMMKVYNKPTLLNDPEHQKKMLNNRSIAKDYTWSDGTVKRAIGSYEYDGFRFMDIFMQFPSEDVIAPAPQVIEYKYEGKDHFYIPDAFIASLNLLVEFKDGGDNPNMHHKIQNVDKKKEKAKEEALKKYNYHYIKIENKQYGEFVNLVNRLRNIDYKPSSNSFTPIIITNEMTDIILESFVEESKSILLAEFEKDGIELFGLLVNSKIYSYINNNIHVYDLSDVYITYEYDILIKDHSFRDYLYDNILDCMKSYTGNEYINNVNFPIIFINDIFEGIINNGKCFISHSNINQFMLFDIMNKDELLSLDFIVDKIYMPEYKNTEYDTFEDKTENEIIYESVSYTDYLKNVIDNYNKNRIDFIATHNLNNIAKETLEIIKLIDSAYNLKDISTIVSVINGLKNNCEPNIVVMLDDAVKLLNSKEQAVYAIKCDNLLDGDENVLANIDVLKIHRKRFNELELKYNSFATRFNKSLKNGYIDYDLICERSKYLNNLDDDVDDDELYYLGIKSI